MLLIAGLGDHAEAARSRRSSRFAIELVRSVVLVSTYARPDALFRSQLRFWRWLAEAVPGERAFFEAFFTWVYTPRAHGDGTVD